MSALAEALLAAQRQAVGVLAKAYVAGTIDAERLTEELDTMGLRDAVDQGLILNALGIVRDFGGDAPKAAGTSGPKAPEPPSDAQRKYIAKLCDERNDERNMVAPDVVVSKDQASEIIEALKAGTYNADAYTVPF